MAWIQNLKTLTLPFFLMLVTACSSGSGSTEAPPKVEEPSDSLDRFILEGGKDSSIDENTTNIRVSTILSGSFSAPLTYRIIGGEDSELFTIDSTSGEVSFTTPPDFEFPTDENRDNIYTVVVEAQENGGQKSAKKINVKVNNVNEQPTLAFSPSVSVVEGELVVGSIETTGGDGGIVTVMISGIDAHIFSINDQNQLEFVSSSDFEMPMDIDSDNQYQLTLDVFENGILESSQLLAVRVTDTIESISQLGIEPLAISGDTSTHFKTAITNMIGESTELEISGGTDSNLFEIDLNGFLVFKLAPDHLNPHDSDGDGIYELELRGSGSSELQGTFRLKLLEPSNLDIVLNMPAMDKDTIRVFDNQSFTFSGSIASEAGLLPSDINELRINGIVIDKINSGEWFHNHNLEFGENFIRFDVLDNQGKITTLSKTIYAQPEVDFIRNSGFEFDMFNQELVVSAKTGPVIIDTQSGRLKKGLWPKDLNPSFVDFSALSSDRNFLALDESKIYSVDLNKSKWDLLVDYSNDDDTRLRSMRGISIDMLSNTAFVLVGDRGIDASVYSINIDTLDKKVLNPPEGSFEINDPNKIAFDSTNNQLLITDWFDESIISINPETGVRKRFSNPNPALPSTFSLNEPAGISIDDDTGLAWFADLASNSNHLVSIDLKTGFYQGLNGKGPEVFEMTDVASDSLNSRLIAMDARRDMIWGVNPESGDRSLIFGSNIGEGPYLWRPRALAIDHISELAYVYTILNDLIEVNLKNGNRRLIAGSNSFVEGPVGSGFNLGDGIEAIAIDKKNQRLIISDIDSDAIITLDLLTGERTVLSSSSRARTMVGEGIIIPGMFDIALDEEGHIYGVDFTSKALIYVDPSSGDRVEISGPNIGTGPAFDSPIALEVDFENKIAFVLDLFPETIVKVDLVSGSREIIELSEKLPSLPDDVYNEHSFELEFNQDEKTLYLGVTGLSGWQKIDVNTGEVKTKLVSSERSRRDIMGMEINFRKNISYTIFYGEPSLIANELNTLQSMYISR